MQCPLAPQLRVCYANSIVIESNLPAPICRHGRASSPAVQFGGEGSLNKQGHVLVIGAASLDIKGRPSTRPVRGSSTPGLIRTSLGGVARNIAENLARLDVETILLTAVGDDDSGAHILGQPLVAALTSARHSLLRGNGQALTWRY